MTGSDVIQPELPLVHLPGPMTSLKVCVHEGKGWLHKVQCMCTLLILWWPLWVEHITL